MEWLDKLLTLGDGKQYVVMTHTEYNGKLYVVVNDVVNGNQLGKNKLLFRVEDPYGHPRFEREENMWTCSKVFWKMSKENK